jgi:hypothetical protein
VGLANAWYASPSALLTVSTTHKCAAILFLSFLFLFSNLSPRWCCNEMRLAKSKAFLPLAAVASLPLVSLVAREHPLFLSRPANFEQRSPGHKRKGMTAMPLKRKGAGIGLVVCE